MNYFEEPAFKVILERAYQDMEFRNLLMTNPLEAISEYDLTKDQKLKFILPNFSWVIENKLAGLARPHSEATLKILKSQGIEALLNLTEMPLDPVLLEKYQIQTKQIPLPDFTAPTIEQLEQAVQLINQFLEAGLKVGVHCGAGLGRTGTILAGYLVSEGMDADEAINNIRKMRPGSIETPEQEAIITHYKNSLSA